MKIEYTKNLELIFNEIENKGFATVENAISPTELTKLQESILQLSNENDGSFSIVGHENLKNTALGKLYQDNEFLELQANLVSKKIKQPIDPLTESKYQVLRVLNGGDVNSQSHLFHFDNYTLTILLPIFIPENKDGLNGDLLVIPNIRKVSSSANKDAIIKIITQNPITRKFLKISMIRKLFNFQKIKLVPGNLYCFWGQSTYHGNDDCNQGSLRSTALFHFHKTVKTKSAFSGLTSTKKRARINN
ncbi:hypothetical protein N8Z89_00045 [bacterium]|nr:hypothetical protein [bacterium]